MCTCVPLSWNLFPPPSPPHLSGLSQSTGFVCPASCIELALVFLFTYGNIYVSLLFSQIILPSPLLRSPKFCSLHLCLFTVLHIGSLLPFFWIPCICVNMLYWCFSFWLISLCIIASISLELTQMCSFFYSWIIFYSVYVPQLPYPFICWLTSRLLPCPSCCKQRCSEHRGTCVSFNSGFLGVYAQQWVAELYGSSVSSF